MGSKHILINAAGIQSGGGLRHITNLLTNANPDRHKFHKISILGSRHLLRQIPDRSWLEKCHDDDLERGLVARAYWQIVHFPKLIESKGPDCVFSLNGLGADLVEVPTVAICHNLEPLNLEELRRTPLLTKHRLRLLTLRRALLKSFSRCQALISLTQYAQDVVLSALSSPPPVRKVVYHGVEDVFDSPAKEQLSSAAFTDARPFELLYVSTVFFYKHQWTVAEAVARVRRKGLPVRISFVGGGLSEAKSMLLRTLDRVDRERKFTQYTDEVPTDQLIKTYHKADGFIFASTCETFGSVLLEAMRSRLPIAASALGPSREILEGHALYFDPLNIIEMAETIERLLNEADLRSKLAEGAFQRSKLFTWDRCADETFKVFEQI